MSSRARLTLPFSASSSSSSASGSLHNFGSSEARSQQLLNICTTILHIDNGGSRRGNRIALRSQLVRTSSHLQDEQTGDKSPTNLDRSQIQEKRHDRLPRSTSSHQTISHRRGDHHRGARQLHSPKPRTLFLPATTNRRRHPSEATQALPPSARRGWDETVSPYVPDATNTPGYWRSQPPLPSHQRQQSPLRQGHLHHP